jgi:Ca-activated chloride channel family protein
MPLRLDAPWLLLLLLIVPLLWLVARLRRGRAPGALLLPSIGPFSGAAVTRRQRLRWLPAALRLLGVALIVVALARPQIGRASSKVPAKGVDIVIALDVSGSMDDPGLSAGTKLDGAKQAIEQFIGTRKNDRVGMVIFESQARVVSPLTLDYQALDQLVGQVRNGLVPDGTAIGLGIADAINLLRSSQAKSRVIILATDGENNINDLEPQTAAQLAAQMHIKLYTIGMFAQGETPQTTEIDESSMQKWAGVTGGFYGRAQSESDLQNIFKRISQLETSTVERTHYTIYDDLEGWLVAPGIALLALEVLLSNTIFRRTP